MHELLSVIKLFRKLEALFLPMLPSKWRNPPPSYRVVLPILERLSLYKERFPWVDALLYSIRKGGYRAYHEDGLATAQMSPIEMRWMRFVLGVVALTMIIAFTPRANALSPWVKGGLLFGSSALLIYGALNLSISAIWASWGFLFPLLGPLTFEAAPWAMIFLGLWVLIWHVPLLSSKGLWRWFDWLATLPILFFWMGINWFQTLSQWQSGLLSLGLWLSIWILLLRMGHHPRISRVLQFFWPASLTSMAITLFWLRPLLRYLGSYDIFPWGWWVLVTVLLSLLMSELTQRILRWSFLFRLSTVAMVFLIYAVSIFISGDLPKLEEWIVYELDLLHYSIWPLWWIIGAGIIMLIREITMVILRWVEVLLPTWILPLTLLVLPALAYYTGFFSFFVEQMGGLSIAGLALGFALGAALFAWRRKETVLREWVFWGFYIFILLYRYWFEEYRTAYGGKTVQGLTSFLFLSMWLLWLTYDAIGEYLTGLRKKGSGGVSAVALMGAFLWLLISQLWLSYVDHHYLGNQPVYRVISLELFRGFTFLGVPFIIYHLVVRQYSRLGSDESMPWGWILIIGIGLVQCLQGVEHYMVAWIEHKSPDALHEELHQAFLTSIQGMEGITPAWVMDSTWAFTWRVIRWLFAMITLTLVIHRSRKGQWPQPIIVSTACFTSLAVGTAEAIWFLWPGMSSYWTVVFRPWVVTGAIWGLDFIRLYLIYGFAGLLWGWFLYRWIQRRNLKTIGVDTVPTLE